MGAKFGFATLWVIPIMCVLLIVVEMTAARMGAVTGKGFAADVYKRQAQGRSRTCRLPNSHTICQKDASDLQEQYMRGVDLAKNLPRAPF